MGNVRFGKNTNLFCEKSTTSHLSKQTRKKKNTSCHSTGMIKKRTNNRVNVFKQDKPDSNCFLLSYLFVHRKLPPHSQPSQLRRHHPSSQYETICKSPSQNTRRLLRDEHQLIHSSCQYSMIGWFVGCFCVSIRLRLDSAAIFCPGFCCG